jgi:hypothetical protein
MKMKILRYDVLDLDLLEDCEKIQSALETVEIYVSILEAYHHWKIYSDDVWYAQWMPIPNNNEEIVEVLTDER